MLWCGYAAGQMRVCGSESVLYHPHVKLPCSGEVCTSEKRSLKVRIAEDCTVKHILTKISTHEADVLQESTNKFCVAKFGSVELSMTSIGTSKLRVAKDCIPKVCPYQSGTPKTTVLRIWRDPC